MTGDGPSWRCGSSCGGGGTDLQEQLHHPLPDLRRQVAPARPRRLPSPSPFRRNLPDILHSFGRPDRARASEWRPFQLHAAAFREARIQAQWMRASVRPCCVDERREQGLILPSPVDADGREGIELHLLVQRFGVAESAGSVFGDTEAGGHEGDGRGSWGQCTTSGRRSGRRKENQSLSRASCS